MDVDDRFLLFFLRLRYLLSQLSLLFHFSEQLIATAVPAKRTTIGIIIRYAMTGDELSYAVTGGISWRIINYVHDNENYYDNKR